MKTHISSKEKTLLLSKKKRFKDKRQKRKINRVKRRIKIKMIKTKILKTKTHKFMKMIQKLSLKEILLDRKNKKNSQSLIRTKIEMGNKGKPQFLNKSKEVKINDYKFYFSI